MWVQVSKKCPLTISICGVLPADKWPAKKLPSLANSPGALRTSGAELLMVGAMYASCETKVADCRYSLYVSTVGLVLQTYTACTFPSDIHVAPAQSIRVDTIKIHLKSVHLHYSDFEFIHSDCCPSILQKQFVLLHISCDMIVSSIVSLCKS